MGVWDFTRPAHLKAAVWGAIPTGAAGLTQLAGAGKRGSNERDARHRRGDRLPAPDLAGLRYDAGQSEFEFEPAGGCRDLARLRLWLVALAGIGTSLAWTVWAQPTVYELKTATLCLGSLLVTPYVLRYDLCILSIAAAFLVKDGLSRGFLAGERTIMLLCLVGLYCPSAPVGPIVCAALLLLVFRRKARIPGALPAAPRQAMLGGALT